MATAYKELVQQLQNLEEHLAVNNPKLLPIVPLIRRHNLERYKAVSRSTRKGKKLSGQIELILMTLRLFLQSIFSSQDDESGYRYFLFDHAVKRNFSTAAGYTNRLMDGLAHFLNNRGKCLLGEYLTDVSQWKSSKSIPTINLFPINLFATLCIRLGLGQRAASYCTKEISYIEDLIKERNWTSIFFDPKVISQDLVRILFLREAFTRLLENHKLHLVFNFCYYSKEAFGLTLACKKLGILCIDVQHGTQGSTHPMYASYPSIASAQTRQLLPGIFWVWSKAEEQHIQDWDSTYLQSVIKGGNPWLAFYKAQNSVQITQDESKESTILVSLQEPQHYHSSYLEELIRRTEGDTHWQWLLRAHPLYPELELELTEAFSDMENVKVMGINKQDLYQQFIQANLHITGFSTTCLEALEFGLPTILIHHNGKDYYQSYIENSYFQYAPDLDTCLEVMKNGSFEVPPKELLQGDQSTVEAAIKIIDP